MVPKKLNLTRLKQTGINTLKDNITTCKWIGPIVTATGSPRATKYCQIAKTLQKLSKRRLVQYFIIRNSSLLRYGTC